MASTSLENLSSLFLLGGLLIAVIGIVIAIVSSQRRSAAQAERERLAQRADAMHEGARTRHEGGA